MTNRLFLLADGEPQNVGHKTIMNEKDVRELAIYYYDNSDVTDKFDFVDIDVCVDFIRRVDHIIELKSLNEKVLGLTMALMNDYHPPAPDSIAEAATNVIPKDSLSDQEQGALYEHIHSLTSLLVKEPGKYL